MQKMRLFVDTHDKRNGTFPEAIDKETFSEVFKNYARACEDEGVVIINSMVGAEDGRMYCINMAPGPDAIRRAHEKAGLRFDSITEVSAASPGDIYFSWK